MTIPPLQGAPRETEFVMSTAEEVERRESVVLNRPMRIGQWREMERTLLMAYEMHAGYVPDWIVNPWKYREGR